MSSRGGRGYGGRGGYNSRGGGQRGYRGGGRGSYEHRGGRGGYSSYNNDSRYNSSGGNRYSSSRDRVDDSYKKYRSESTTYSSRDYGGRVGSPERKRMRMEGSSSDRRSHDGGGHHYSGSYGGGRQESYGGGERRQFVSESRRRSPSREPYRKAHMGPPRDGPRPAPRARAPRRSYRGRMLRSRPYRGAPRSRASFTSRRFTDRSLGYTRAFRSIKARSPAKSKDEASSTEEDWDADEKEETPVEKKESKVAKTPQGDEEEEEVGSEGEGGEGGDDTEKENEGAGEGAVRRARPLVRLVCVHCKEKAISFGGYAKHLMSTRHRAAMGGVARRHKAQLLRMRVAQRAAQRDLEASAEELAPRTTFCLICRLNHRTTRHDHNLTDTHRAMKRFLMPYCRVCRLAFRSPMMFEHHIASIDHLKKKANQGTRRASPKGDGSGDEGMDVDLDNFMTLDSVGDVDEVEDDDSGTEKKDDSTSKKAKVEINIGSEHIKKCEVYWCELCRVYLPRAEPGSAEAGEALRRHCRLRLHLGRYVQHRDTRTLRKHAERIHRQLHTRPEDEKSGDAGSPEKIKVEKKDTEESKAIENGDAVNTGEDKMWADVDKDIGELLREVDPQGHEGSEDEEDLGRYDKFRKSDKTQNGAGEENESTTNTTEEKKATEVEAV